MLDSFGALRFSQDLFEYMQCFLGASLFKHVMDDLSSRSGRFEGVMAFDDGDSSMMADNGSHMSGPPDVSYSSNDSSVSSEHSVEGFSDTGVLGESVSSHNGEQFMDHSVGMSGSVSNNRVELIDEPVMGNDGVHDVSSHVHMTF